VLHAGRDGAAGAYRRPRVYDSMGARRAGAVLREGRDLREGHDLHAAIREWRSITRAREDNDTGVGSYALGRTPIRERPVTR
jgi:hypothetical protein